MGSGGETSDNLRVDEVYEAQGSGCALCLIQMPLSRLKKYVHLNGNTDLICWRCNEGLRQFEYSPLLLQWAQEFLRDGVDYDSPEAKGLRWIVDVEERNGVNMLYGSENVGTSAENIPILGFMERRLYRAQEKVAEIERVIETQKEQERNKENENNSGE